MTAFLGPSELAATFRATEDPELKKAVIDTLEHIGSPASLNALGNCFEDADSDIQVLRAGGGRQATRRGLRGYCSDRLRPRVRRSLPRAG